MTVMDATPYILVIWLMKGGPDLQLNVPTCDVAEPWYRAALAWAERSGVDITQPGFMCGKPIQFPDRVLTPVR